MVEGIVLVFVVQIRPGIGCRCPALAAHRDGGGCLFRHEGAGVVLFVVGQVILKAQQLALLQGQLFGLEVSQKRLSGTLAGETYPGGSALGGKVTLQLRDLCPGLVLRLGGLLFPVGVVAFQLLVGLSQLGAGSVPLGGEGGDLLLLALDVGAVQVHDLPQLFVGDAGDDALDFFPFHVMSFLPYAFCGVAPTGCTVLRRAGQNLG